MSKSQAVKKVEEIQEVSNFLDTEDFIIEKGIPLQPIQKGVVKYPFHKMDVGDSFSVPKPDGRKLRSASSAYAKRIGKKFTVRTQGGVVRLWRVE